MTLFRAMTLALSALLPLRAGAAELSPHAWTIVTVSVTEARNDARIAFAADGGVSGSTGCNRFHGRSSLHDGVLTVGPLASTRMGCAGPLAAQEAAIFSMLAAPLSVAVDLEARRATLRAGDGRSLVLSRRP